MLIDVGEGDALEMERERLHTGMRAGDMLAGRREGRQGEEGGDEEVQEHFVLRRRVWLLGFDGMAMRCSVAWRMRMVIAHEVKGWSESKTDTNALVPSAMRQSYSHDSVEDEPVLSCFRGT